MNDTNNSNENVNNVPVQNAVPSEQPVVQNVTPVQSVQPENTNVTPTGDGRNSSEEAKVEEEKKEVYLSKTEEEVRNAKLRFPIIVTVLVTIFLILILLYCFVFTTPDKVYTKILKTSVDKIVGLVDFHNTSDEFTNTEANIVFDTKSVDFDSKDILSHIDGLTYKVKFNRDNKNKNFEFVLTDNIKDLDGKTSFKHGESVNSKMYYIDSNIYAKPSKDFISVRRRNINFQRRRGYRESWKIRGKENGTDVLCAGLQPRHAQWQEDRHRGLRLPGPCARAEPEGLRL